MNIPSTLRAGDTIAWDESIPDYPASAGWTLAFVLTKYGQSLITITATTSGDDYAISVLPATSRTWIAGIYSWMAYVYKSSGTPVLITEKYTVKSGDIEILPDITQATSTTDLRSYARKTLDELEIVLQVKAAGGDISAYSIAGRSASKYPPETLENWRDKLRAECRLEIENQIAAKGVRHPRHVGIRFDCI